MTKAVIEIEELKIQYQGNWLYVPKAAHPEWLEAFSLKPENTD